MMCVLKVGQEEVCASILGNVPGDSVILFGKVCLWVLVMLFTGCAQHHHNRARSRGYLRFYRQMQGLKHLPLTVHSAGTTAHMLSGNYKSVYCTCRGQFSPQDGSNTKGITCVCVSVCLCAGNVLLLVVLAAQLSLTVHTYMLLSILGLELLVALPCLLYYTGKLISVIKLITSTNTQSKFSLSHPTPLHRDTD